MNGPLPYNGLSAIVNVDFVDNFGTWKQSKNNLVTSEHKIYGNKETWLISAGEQGNKAKILKETWEFVPPPLPGRPSMLAT